MISDLQTHTGFWLRLVSNHVSQSFAKRVEATGVTVAEWVVLRQMYDAPVTSPSTIADSTGLTRGAISKLIDRLLEKNLVTRTEAEGDRRYQNVGLTKAGRQLVPKLADLADQNDEEFFSRLPSKDRQHLLAILKKLADANRLTNFPTE